jgi:FkbM family methyltransferase
VRLETLRQRALILARAVRNRDGERTDTLRLIAFRLARRVTPLIGVESDGVRFIVNTQETAGVGVTVFIRGGYEENTLQLALAELERHTEVGSLAGLTVLEIGANIGSETVSMIARHGVARVIAAEPDAENARLLRANVALNGLTDRVDVHELALSDTDGSLTLELSRENWGDHRIRVDQPDAPSLAAEQDRATAEVRTRRLDTLHADGVVDVDAIDLVWMDVQGHEAHVLAGAEQLLARGVPIMTEYWPYGLQRAGGLDRFHELVSDHFAFVVDLHPQANRSSATLPAARVAELAQRYAPPRYPDPFVATTDLLLIPARTSA